MKVYQTNEIRNVSLIGNAGSGKTTLAEAIAFNGGIITRRGEVDNKNTISDNSEVEQHQGNSVFSSILHTEWKDKKVNLLDTPGGDDFIGGSISALHVTDTALIVLNTQNGIEVGAEVAWRNTEKFQKPVILVANHLDHENVVFDKLIEDAKELLSKKVAIVQYPINAGLEFDSVIDLVKMKLLKWTKDGVEPEILDIPDSEKDKAAELKNELIEAAAESDEELMELFFENDGLTEDEMMRGIRNGIISRDLFPVFCTSAKKNIGIGRLLDFITNVAPSPELMPAAKTTEEEKEIKCDASEKVSLFTFKNSIETHVGEVIYFKVMSGLLTESQDLVNQNKHSKERISQIFVVAGKKKEKVDKMYAGDIGATVKLKDTKSEHTLSEKDFDVEYLPIDYPEPKYRTAIKAINESDDEKLGTSLNKINDEDPTVLVKYSKELKQLIVSGQGEYHIATVKWMLSTQYKIETELFSPKIPYRETITRAAYSSYRHKKQSGGAGQFGEVHMVVDPYVETNSDKKDPKTKTFKFKDKEIVVNIRAKDVIELNWGGKFVFYNCIVGGSIEKSYMPAIIKGIMEKLENSPLTGSYARDLNVYIFDGKMHPVDSNEISFKLAGRYAFDEAFRAAKPKIMEPIYDVEIMVPGDSMGDVMSDLQGRRSIIQGMTTKGRYEVISVKVPLAELDKYSTSLSSLTSGRATYSMKYDEYAQVPSDVQDVLLKTHMKDQEDE